MELFCEHLHYYVHATGIFCMLGIFCILCLFTRIKVLHQAFIVYCFYCLVPHPRAQLFTYHHLQPSVVHHHRLLIYSMKLWKSQPILIAWQRVLSRLRRLEQEEGFPVRRTLESHTTIVLFHSACRRLQIDTAPPRQWSM